VWSHPPLRGERTLSLRISEPNGLVTAEPWSRYRALSCLSRYRGLSCLSRYRGLSCLSRYREKRMKSLNCSLPVPRVALR
jgi:hypothetical protein